MKRSTSAFFIVLAAINIAIALVPPCVGGFGVSSAMSDTKININGREIGAEFDKAMAKTFIPMKAEAFVAFGLNTICCLLLIGGAVGLFMAQTWARWLSVGAGVLMIFSLCGHDIYQIAVYRPAMLAFFDQNLPADLLREGIKWTMQVPVWTWSCANSFIIIYLVAMCLCLSLLQGFRDGTEIGTAGSNASRRDRDDDDDDADERPKKKRKRTEDDEADDERPSKPKKKSRGEDEED